MKILFNNNYMMEGIDEISENFVNSIRQIWLKINDASLIDANNFYNSFIENTKNQINSISILKDNGDLILEIVDNFYFPDINKFYQGNGNTFLTLTLRRSKETLSDAMYGHSSDINLEEQYEVGDNNT